MSSPHVQHQASAAAISRHPIHATLVPFPIVCFTLTLLTDIAYWQTSHLMWQYFSEWLLLAGLIFGVFAAIVGAVDFTLRPRIRAQRPAWPHAIGSLVALALAVLNSLVHAGDGWTGVVPYGLILSAATVLVLLITDWFGRAMVFRYGAGVTNYD